MGQVPVTVERELEGFVLNRLQGALLNEALRLVAHGLRHAPRTWTGACKNGLGLRWSFMGPFETIDLNAPGRSCPTTAARYGGFYDRLEAQLAATRRLETMRVVTQDRRRPPRGIAGRRTCRHPASLARPAADGAARPQDRRIERGS